MKKIIGNEKIQDYFREVLNGNRINHAYCLVGPQMVGKKTFVYSLASEVLKIPVEKIKSHPDFLLIEPSFNKDGKAKKNIDIEQAEVLRNFLSRKSYFGGFNIALVDSAEMLNLSSANSLLKAIEEPAAKSIVFFLTSKIDYLPKTIVSRCQRINFYPVKTEQLIKELKEIGIEENKAKLLAVQSNGLPGQAIIWSNNLDEYDKFLKEKENFYELFGLSLVERMKKIEVAINEEDDFVSLQNSVLQLLNNWEIALSELLNGTRKNLDNLDNNVYSQEILVKVWKTVVEVKRLIGYNINPKILIEKILLEMP